MGGWVVVVVIVVVVVGWGGGVSWWWWRAGKGGSSNLSLAAWVPGTRVKPANTVPTVMSLPKLVVVAVVQGGVRREK